MGSPAGLRGIDEAQLVGVRDDDHACGAVDRPGTHVAALDPQAAAAAGCAVEQDLVDDDDVPVVAATAEVGRQRPDAAVVVVDDKHPVAVQQQLAAPALSEKHPTGDGGLGTGDVHHRQRSVLHQDDATPVGLDDVGLVHADHLHVRAGEVGSAGPVVATGDGGGSGCLCAGGRHGEVGCGGVLVGEPGPREDGAVPVAVQAVRADAADCLGADVSQQAVAVTEVPQRRDELHVVAGRGGLGGSPAVAVRAGVVAGTAGYSGDESDGSGK